MIEQPQINVNDIYNAQQIIKVAMERGVFKAEEYTQVGSVYDRLSGYIKQIQEQHAAEAQAASEPEPEVTEDTPKKKGAK